MSRRAAQRKNMAMVISRLSERLPARLLAVALATAMIAPAQQAQSAPPNEPAPISGVSGAQAVASAPWFGSPSYLRKTFFYDDVRVDLRAPVRLRDFVVNGKLTLSLRNYLQLVLANNTDIEIQRVQLEFPKNAIQRALGIFDPLLSGSFSATRAESEASNSLQGASVLSTLTQPFALNYGQTLGTGLQVYAGVATQKTSTNSSYSFYNPGYTTSLDFGFTQPLLRGRGSYVTHLPITIAKRQRVAAEYNFSNILISSIANAENAYWDVISAHERLKVQQQTLALAEKSLARTRKEIELQATSALEVYQPEQQFAQAKLDLALVEYQVRQTEDVLRRQMGADLDPEIRQLPIEVTEDVSASVDETPYDREQLVQRALGQRPDLRNLQTTEEVNKLQIRSAAEQLKPQLSLNASYTTTGVGGRYIPTTTDANGNTVYLPAIPGGITDAFSQMFGFSYPTWQFGISLNLPLRDHAAAANMADAVANRRQNALSQRSLQQQIRQDVLTAVTQVEGSRAAVKLAQTTVDFAVKRAEADQQRYDLGVITMFLLLSGQSDLANARSNLVSQIVQYRRDRLNLEQKLGELLADRGIVAQ
jgi:outer membrane protein TolC